MKLLLALLVTIGAAHAQEVKPCLAVYPQPADRSSAGNVAPVLMPFALAHGDRYLYLESRGLTVKDIKTKYKKSELQKLEERGIRIVVTTKEGTGGPSAPAGCN